MMLNRFIILLDRLIYYLTSMKATSFLKAILISLFLALSFSNPIQGTAGFQIGQVQGYKLLNSSGSSKLYEINCPQIQDGRPMKLIQLVGSHYDVGFDYASLLGPQIQQTYKIFMTTGFANPIERHILQLFLDWQYDNFISKGLPQEFNQQLRGIQNGGMKGYKVSLRILIQRTLVVSSYPGDIGVDIMYAMVDVFLEKSLKITNPKLLDYVQNNLFRIVKFLRHFMNKKRIHCSFMAAWGSKTVGGKLYTMRNLDWQANTGINKHKLIFVWKVKGTIPHATIGYPAILGALAGISQAGLTVHEAGLDSMKQTELGFQWTLRLRYVMMYAHNLGEAKAIWNRTQNTFGMNHMIASAADVVTGTAPIFVVQTMRGYNAWFTDLDKRQDGVNFTDPTTKHSFKAGYAMKDAVFRTNHAYDPKINTFRTEQLRENGSTFKRYVVLKDSLNFYGKNAIGELQALNITANVAHKGGQDLYHCPTGKDDGTNVISVMFIPGEQRMYAAIEYGTGSTYKTACCGVYLNIDLSKFFSLNSYELMLQNNEIIE